MAKPKEKPVLAQIKLQIPGAKASPAPPVGPALGQHGVAIMDFCQAFNAATKDKGGLIIPVVITVYQDRSFSFITKTPPASILIKKVKFMILGPPEATSSQLWIDAQNQKCVYK